MGLATAKILGREHFMVIAGRSREKLDHAVAELTAMGVEARAVVCDVADRSSVENLAREASAEGDIVVVIHAAGISPNMGSPEMIMQINALGTVHIHDVFFHFLNQESCLIDVASMGGHIVPRLFLPTMAYRVCYDKPEYFLKKLVARASIFPGSLRSGVAYGISKNFVIWLVKKDAARFGKKGIRLLSVSPGAFETDMGEIEQDGAEQYAQYCAIERFGYVDEIAHLLACCADKRLGYLTGTDIICDGGCLAGYQNTSLSMLGLTHKR